MPLKSIFLPAVSILLPTSQLTLSELSGKARHKVDLFAIGVLQGSHANGTRVYSCPCPQLLRFPLASGLKIHLDGHISERQKLDVRMLEHGH